MATRSNPGLPSAPESRAAVPEMNKEVIPIISWCIMFEQCSSLRQVLYSLSSTKTASFPISTNQGDSHFSNPFPGPQTSFREALERSPCLPLPPRSPCPTCSRCLAKSSSLQAVGRVLERCSRRVSLSTEPRCTLPVEERMFWRRRRRRSTLESSKSRGRAKLLRECCWWCQELRS